MCLTYIFILLLFYNSVNCECWKVRVGKDAVEPIIRCYAGTHMYRQSLARIGLLPRRFDFGPCQAVWDFWRTKWHTDKVFFRVL